MVRRKGVRMERTLFIVCAVLSLSWASLSGAIYTNDTGTIAYDFRIVFEAPVVITSYAPVFPEKEPEGEAMEFTFTGGTVLPGGTFWLSWRPAGVRAVAVEWITTPGGGTTPKGTPSIVTEAQVSALSENHIREETFTATLRCEEGEEIKIQVTRRLSDRMIPFLAEYEIEGGDGLSFHWDLNHYVDSDHDGIFRNDADAVGREARAIYFSNRTPYIVTLWAEDEEGTLYRWEDDISFNVQNGDRVFLDARSFLADVNSVEWEVAGADPRDTNFRISYPTSKRATLTSRYPGVTHVILKATDGNGNQHEYDTTLYVFNKNPDIFKVRGMRVVMWPPNALGYFNKAFSYLKELGFNYIKFPIYWHFTLDNNGSFHVIPQAGCSDQMWCNDTILENYIQLAHELGFGVELHLEIGAAPESALQNRNRVPMNEKFFEGPEGYFAFVKHYIDIANKNGVEVFIGKTEIINTEFYNARPWMDKLIELMREGLVSSEYTLENFIGQWGTPKPWEIRYGTDLSKLRLIEWSPYPYKWASNNKPTISELMWAFNNKVLYVFTRVHQRFPELKQRIGELGVGSCDGCTVKPDEVTSEKVDKEEQEIAAAAILRSLMDYIKRGNDFLDGWFWHALTIARDLDKLKERNNFDLWYKPAMDEFYVFYSSEPKMLPVLPYFNNIYQMWYYINPLQDIHLIHDTSRISSIQDFEESNNPYVFIGQLHYYKQFSDADVKIASGVAYQGNQSLEVALASEYGMGANTCVRLKTNGTPWDKVEAISIAVKREDPSVGVALMIPMRLIGDTPVWGYTARLPVSKVGEWEHFVIPISDFVTLGDDGEYEGIVNPEMLNPWDLYVIYYPTKEGPIDTKVYIDNLGVIWKD